MPVPLDFLKNAWADTGDRVQFPYNPDTITELMSWIKGFTAKYQRLPEEGGVYIDRREFNQILYLLTKQVIDAFKITAGSATGSGSGVSTNATSSKMFMLEPIGTTPPFSLVTPANVELR